MRWPAAVLIAALCLPALSGCRGSRGDLVEAELRSREAEVRELRDEVDRLQHFNHALEAELRDTRAAHPRPTVEGAVSDGMVKDVALGRQTGGSDLDRYPGDEGLRVVVVPRDADGHAVKVPGTLRVVAYEVTPEGLKIPLGNWDVPAVALRRTWQTGLLSTGYHVVLPWKKFPTNAKVRVVAQFLLTDGRPFEAEKDVTIRLVPPTPTPPNPPAAELLPAVPGIPDPPGTELPLPTTPASSGL